MNSLEKAVLARAVGVIAPSAAGIDKGPFLKKADKMTGRFYPLDRIGVGVMLLLLEFCPIFFIRKPKRFTKLNSGEALEYLRALENSPFPFSYLLTVTKMITLIAFYGLPDGKASAGYSTPPTPEFKEVAD